MAYKKSSAPLSFAKSAFLLAITIIILSARLSQATKGKASADAEVSFVSSESDWSKDLDNVKPFGPSANAANLDPHIGYEAYRTLRFKIGTNCANTLLPNMSTKTSFMKGSDTSTSIRSCSGDGYICQIPICPANSELLWFLPAAACYHGERSRCC